jgi:hypothetical protein
MKKLWLRWDVWLLGAAACAAGAQTASSGVPAGGAALKASAALREIHDPHTGLRWLLVKDAAHPGGPGMLVEVSPREPGAETGRVAAPLIHAGDAVLVEEHNAVVDAVLQAVALGPAVSGGLFSARLKVGGRVLQVVAVAPGRAKILFGTGGGQ